jgi:hypothetical protein
LQADQLSAERLGENLGDLRLADARLTLQKERPAHLEGQEEHGGERPVGDIARLGQEAEGVVDGARNGSDWHGGWLAFGTRSYIGQDVRRRTGNRRPHHRHREMG